MDARSGNRSTSSRHNRMSPTTCNSIIRHPRPGGRDRINKGSTRHGQYDVFSIKPGITVKARKDRDAKFGAATLAEIRQQHGWQGFPFDLPRDAWRRKRDKEMDPSPEVAFGKNKWKSWLKVALKYSFEEFKKQMGKNINHRITSKRLDSMTEELEDAARPRQRSSSTPRSCTRLSTIETFNIDSISDDSSSISYPSIEAGVDEMLDTNMIVDSASTETSPRDSDLDIPDPDNCIRFNSLAGATPSYSIPATNELYYASRAESSDMLWPYATEKSPPMVLTDQGTLIDHSSEPVRRPAEHMTIGNASTGLARVFSLDKERKKTASDIHVIKCDIAKLKRSGHELRCERAAIRECMDKIDSEIVFELKTLAAKLTHDASAGMAGAESTKALLHSVDREIAKMQDVTTALLSEKADIENRMNAIFNAIGQNVSDLEGKQDEFEVLEAKLAQNTKERQSIVQRYVNADAEAVKMILDKFQKLKDLPPASHMGTFSCTSNTALTT